MNIGTPKNLCRTLTWAANDNYQAHRMITTHCNMLCDEPAAAGYIAQISVDYGSWWGAPMPEILHEMEQWLLHSFGASSVSTWILSRDGSLHLMGHDRAFLFKLRWHLAQITL